MPTSFVAEACAGGVDAVAIDPAYAEPPAVLAELAADGTSGGTDIVDSHDDRFTYRWYGSPQRRAELRAEALARFTEHRFREPGRYVTAALPRLPFGDTRFDLALCSHLLFTWSDDLDEQFHRAALLELCRVAREVRAFPLVRQGTGTRSRSCPTCASNSPASTR